MKTVRIGVYAVASAIVSLAMPAMASVRVVINPVSTNPVTWTSSSDNPTIELKDKQDAVIYFSNGTQQRITGPYKGPLRQSHGLPIDPGSFLGRVAAVFASAESRDGNLGASRSAAAPPVPDEPPATLPAGVDPLDISLDTPATQCQLTPPLYVWTGAPAGQTLVLSRMDAGAAKLDVTASGSRLAWPHGVSPGGGDYVVSYLNPVSGSPLKTHKLTIKTLTLSDPDNYSVADLVAADCIYQAKIKARLLIKAQASQP